VLYYQCCCCCCCCCNSNQVAVTFAAIVCCYLLALIAYIALLQDLNSDVHPEHRGARCRASSYLHRQLCRDRDPKNALRKCCLLKATRLTQLLATSSTNWARSLFDHNLVYHLYVLARMCEPELKRVALSSAKALSDAEVQHVLSFCSGQGLFVMLVCKQWRDLFCQADTQTTAAAAAAAAQGGQYVHKHDSRCTTRGAVFASAARLKAAHGLGCVSGHLLIAGSDMLAAAGLLVLRQSQ
jgi:hypothetical protein